MYISARKFYIDSCFEKASTLSYVTILSVVPVAILVFAFLSSYEYTSVILEQNLKHVLHLLFGVGLESDIASYLKDFSQNVSSISYLGIIFLLLISVDIILILEKAINRIWNIKKGRSFIQNFLIYWSVITITPFFLISSFYLTSKYNFSDKLSFESFPLIVTSFGFFLIYAFLPRKKVNIIPALTGAIIAGLVFEASKLGFGLYISELANRTLKKIYGGHFYIIPIFIAWIYLSYAILLYGAEVAYLLQHKETFKNKLYKHIPKKEYTLFFLLNTIYHILDNFENEKGETSLQSLAKQNNISQTYMENIAEKLIELSMIQESANKAAKHYLPIKPKDKIKIIDIINSLDTRKQYIATNTNKAMITVFNKVQNKMNEGINKTFDSLSFNDLIKES